MSGKAWSILLVIAVFLAVTPAAKAVPLLTFAYEGTVNSTSGGAAFDAFLGQTLRIEYTFDAATPDLFPGDATIGFYSGAISAFALSVATNTYLATGGTLVVFDNRFSLDRYNGESTALTGPSIAGGTPFVGSFLFSDTTLAAFMSTALPLTPPDPALFPTLTLLRISFLDSGGGFLGDIQVNSGIENVTTGTMPTAIPEPASLPILATGLAGLGLLAWRRRKVAGSTAGDQI